MSKKIIVTGAAGFIGSHLTEKLVELGCVESDQFGSFDLNK